MRFVNLEKPFDEEALAALAKKFREAAKVSKAEAGRELGVSRMTVHQAEECPGLSLTKLRCRMIEKYSPYDVVGPVFLMKKK